MVQTVLITGASGFIGAHLLHVFLGAGYHVRAAVRSESTADRVRKTHGKYGDALSFALVPDLTAPGAFDDAIKGVDGVIHAASPFIINAKDYDKELFDPAVKGTLSVLQAAKKFNPGIKRIVITSSFAAVLDASKGLRPGYTYTEADWNPMTIEEARKSDPTSAYLVSKTLAEKAAFDFVKTEEPNFSITTLAPPMVYGPIAHEVRSLDSLNTSSADIYRLINGSSKELPDTDFWAFADVRDLAVAHLRGYESPEAANRRYLITNGSYSYELFCNIIREKFPEISGKVPSGKNHPLSEVYKVDNSRSKKELGITYRSMEETIVDAIAKLKELEQALR